MPDVEAVACGAILSNYQRVRVEHVCVAACSLPAARALTSPHTQMLATNAHPHRVPLGEKSDRTAEGNGGGWDGERARQGRRRWVRCPDLFKLRLR